MKLLLTADWHLDRNNRLEDFISAIGFITTYAVEERIEHVCILGDIYRDWMPSSVERMAFHHALKALVDNKIFTTIVLGNHDINEKQTNFFQHALSEFVGISNPLIRFVYESPKLIDFAGHSVLAIPHLSRAYTKDLMLQREAFSAALTRFSGQYELAVGHALIFDAIDGACNPEDPRGLHLKDISPLLTAPLFLGDIHAQKIVNTQPLIAYTGSPERVTFNEIEQTKGFLVYDLSLKSPQFVSVPARKFFQINVDMDSREFSFKGAGGAGSMPLGSGDTTNSLVSVIKAAAEVISGAVVKLVVTGHIKDLGVINRAAIIAQLKLCSPYKIAKISFVCNDNTVARDTAFTEQLTPGDAFNRWADKQNYQDIQLQASVLSAGRELLNAI